MPGLSQVISISKTFRAAEQHMGDDHSGSCQCINLILMRNFFMDLPEEIEESSKMDGCNEFTFIWKILIPLSLPAIATIGLFYGVAHWNEFFKGVFFILRIHVNGPCRYC